MAITNFKGRNVKTPQWKVDKAQEMYAEGESIQSISKALEMGTSTVDRYCRDIDHPHRSRLTTAQVSDLFGRWGRAQAGQKHG